MRVIPIDLSGKTAIVTGAGQGLGAAAATLLHGAGANVAINYFNDPRGVNHQRAQALAERLGERAAALDADVRRFEQVEVMVEQVVERFGGLDILVNNAGIIRDRTLKKMALEDWHAVLETNLTGVFHTCKAAEPVLADGGRIVNLASIAGVVGFFGQSNYAAAKAGIIGMTKVLSKELARRRITVNAVAPGVINTEMAQSIPEDVRAQMVKNIPLGYFGEPEDIARVVLFLCSDLASYVTGQVIHVNGGWWG